MRRAKSLRIGVHHANAVVWGPVYRTHLNEDVRRMPEHVHREALVERRRRAAVDAHARARALVVHAHDAVRVLRPERLRVFQPPRAEDCGEGRVGGWERGDVSSDVSAADDARSRTRRLGRWIHDRRDGGRGRAPLTSSFPRLFAMTPRTTARARWGRSGGRRGRASTARARRLARRSKRTSTRV